MKTINLKHLLVLFTVLSIGFTACTKDDPVPEENQEEYDSAVIKFTNIEDADDVVEISFDKDGHPTPHHAHLSVGYSYAMDITLLYNGQSINDEIIEAGDEHQFFFLGAPEEALIYDYVDEQIGLKGIVSILDPTDAFDWNILLRHGLDKTHEAASIWNNPNYAQAGGSDDINITFEIHPTVGDADHDH